MTLPGSKSSCAIDTHVHLWPTGLIHPSQRGDVPLSATSQALLQTTSVAGVDIAVATPAVVHEANDFVLAAAEASSGRIRAVALIDPWDPQCIEELMTCSERNAIGVRIMPRAIARNFPKNPDPLAHLLDATADLNLVVQWTVPITEVESIEFAATRQPMLQQVLDHMGLPADPADQELLARLRSVSEIPRLHVKLSGFYALSHVGYPYRDVWAWAEQVVQAFGADRTMWASDWPLSVESAGYVEQLQLVHQLPFLGDRERSSLLSGTPAAFWSLRSPD